MSMSANFHNISKVELDTLYVSALRCSHPALTMHDEQGCYICIHMTDANVKQLEAAIASYRETQLCSDLALSA